MQWPKIKHFVPIIGIILLSAVFRFAYLDRIPTAISGDELHYAITAKSIWLTGHDIGGFWNPLSVFLFRYPPHEQQAELPYFLHLFFSSPFHFSLLSARIPFALLSIGIVILLYLTGMELFETPGATAIGLIAAVNPWLVVMGRTAYEATPAMFFYLLAFYLLLRNKGWNILWTFVPMVFAFYSYIATKIIFIPFIITGTLFSFYLHKNKFAKQYLILCLTCFLFLGGFLFLLKTSPDGSRLGEILLPNSPGIATAVDAARKASLQTLFVPITINKYTMYLQTIESKFFRVFSSSYLFSEGDQFFLPVRQSFFYYIDAILICITAIYFSTKKRLTTVALFLFILIGTLPQLLHKNSGDFSIHLTMMFPFIILLIGAGIGDITQALSNNFRKFVAALFIVAYGLNVGNFAFTYFNQYPLSGSSDFPMRILTKYLTVSSQANVPIIVYSNHAGDIFSKYIFYSDAMNHESMQLISHINTNAPFNFQNIHFTDCDAGIKNATSSAITIYDTNCAMTIDGPGVTISSLLDGGQQYKIFNDTVCSSFPLKSYPAGVTLKDLAVEQLSPSDFCKTFISH